MKILPALLTALLLTTGCGSEKKANEDSAPDAQKAYSNQIEQQQKKITEARESNNDLLSKKAEEAAHQALKASPVVAEKWQATVEKISSDGDSTKIISQYKTHTYTLRIAENSVKDWTSTLKSGDQITFSGNMGTERSITTEGGLRNPEFLFFPSRIRLSSESNDHTQSEESINDTLIADAKLEKQNTITEAVDSLCEAEARSKALNKRSADFSVLRRNIVQTDSATWLYSNDVTLQNAYGAKITHRVICAVKTRIGPSGSLQAKVVSIKFTQ